MSDKYLEPVNDHFALNAAQIQDVDDDIFLSNSRVSSSKANVKSNSRTQSPGGNPFEEESDSSDVYRQQLIQKRREIEARSLESTQKSLSLLDESEKVGTDTALELARQREQLERADKQLDSMNASLRFSQKHINSIKSVFGSFKNYLQGNRDAPPPPAAETASDVLRKSPTTSQRSSISSSSTSYQQKAIPTNEPYDRDHPISRLRDLPTTDRSSHQQQEQKLKSSDPFQAEIESNIGLMSDNISRLKFLATDLGKEIESQNGLLDNMSYKIEDVDIKVAKQNKSINKLLGK